MDRGTLWSIILQTYFSQLLNDTFHWIKLNLQAFEYSLDVVSIAVTTSGEQLRLMTANAAVKLKGDELTSIVTIDSH